MGKLCSIVRKRRVDIDVFPSRIGEIVNGSHPITADTAIRLGLFFKIDSRFWLKLQKKYDMRVAKRKLQKEIEPRKR